MTLKTQWLYYVSLSDQLQKRLNNNTSETEFVLSEHQLPHVITMLETRLGSHVSNDKCVNLIVYVTDCKHAPLHFIKSSGKIHSSFYR